MDNSLNQISSLHGRINPKEMGSRAQREKPSISIKNTQIIGYSPFQKPKSSNISSLMTLSSIQTLYRPSNRDSKQIWEYLIALMARILKSFNPSSEMIMEAADQVLEAMKSKEEDSTIKDLDRKMSLEQILNLSLNEDFFGQIQNLTRRINDYSKGRRKETQRQQRQEESENSHQESNQIDQFNQRTDKLKESFSNSTLVSNSVSSSASTAVAVVFEESEGEELEELVEEEAAIEMEEQDQNQENQIENDQNQEKPFSMLNQDAFNDQEELNDQGINSFILDLNSLAFSEGSHVMTNRKCLVPQGSIRTNHPGYEEINIPPPPPPNVEISPMPTSVFPEWCRKAFDGIDTLNPIQSVVASCAFNSDDNFLLCAPTGAGKTNVALIAILRALGKEMEERDKLQEQARERELKLEQSRELKQEREFELNNKKEIQRKKKIVYVAPMKALVQEMTLTFSKKLASLGCRVAELTGDAQLSSREMENIDIIITTPEKWDIVTRKRVDQGVSLMIIDEIHLLHDMRGPVLEALISRTKRWCPGTRIVGLSATLPNYRDVARNLGIDQDSRIFFFDSSFRPCPLVQSFIGVKEKKPLKRTRLINEILYAKVMERAGKHQIVIFVHSRRDTSTTAEFIRDQSVADGGIGKFLLQSSSSRQILQESNVENEKLKELLIYGFAIHHAGMSRGDRSLVEGLFSQGHIQLLVSTATLAWGVNLPAHTVIVKGTELYSSERGGWIQLSSQDVLQMLGRAGRPQYDIEGEGIIITTHEQVQFYLSLMNQQLPIESQMIVKLPEHLNAEIVLGHVKDLDDVLEWIKSLYLYIRMQCEPAIYGNIALTKLALTVVTILERAGLIVYDRHCQRITCTNLGRIASYYYITPQAIDVYASHLRIDMDEMDILHVFSLSPEFKQLTVRLEEKLELNQLVDRVPIPIKNISDSEASTKVNILLQTYISRLRLEGFALMADMSFIVQSAGRLFRALMMIAMQKGWSYVVKRSLDFGKMIHHRQWLAQSPLRQMSISSPLLSNLNNRHQNGISKLESTSPSSIPMIGNDILRRLERKDFSWSHLFDLEPSELGELIRNPRIGRELWQSLRLFPRVELQINALPITKNIMRIECNIMPIWTFDPRIHRSVEIFWIFIEDSEGSHLLYQDQIPIRSNKKSISQGKEEISFSFTIDIGQDSPHHPVLFAHVYSDRWIGSECHVPIVLNKFIPPSPPSEITPIEDVDAIGIFIQKDCLNEMEMKGKVGEGMEMEIYPESLPIQTAIYPIIKETKESILIAAPEGSGRSLMAYVALMNQINSNFNKNQNSNNGNETGNNNFNSSSSVLILACNQSILKRFSMSSFFPLGSILPIAKGDYNHDNELLRRNGFICATPEEWQHSISRIDPFFSMIIILEIHLIGTGIEGIFFEMTLTDIRQRIIDNPHTRLIVTSESLYDANSISSWLGLTRVFNYPPSILSKTILYNEKNVESMDTINKNNQDGNEIENETKKKLSNSSLSNIISIKREEIGKYAICKHVNHPILIDINPFENEGNASFFHNNSKLMTSMIAEDHGHDHDFGGMGMEYSISDLKHLISLTDLVYIKSKEQYIEHYKSFIKMPIPIESHLNHFLGDWILSKLATDSISTKQDIIDLMTWSFLYRRILKNPNYYGLFEIGQRALSEHLSALLERTIEELENLNFLKVINPSLIKDTNEMKLEDDQENNQEHEKQQEEYLEIQNLGMIAAWYRVSPVTIELFLDNVQIDSNLAHLIELLSFASELGRFKSILPSLSSIKNMLLENENENNQKSNENEMDGNDGNQNQFKKIPFDSESISSILIQAHISRIVKNENYNEIENVNENNYRNENMKSLISIPHGMDKLFIKLANAMIDIIASSKRWSRPVIQLMELIQMIKRARWDHDDLLSQLFLLDEEFLLFSSLSKSNLQSQSPVKMVNDLNSDSVNDFDSCSVYDLIDDADLFKRWIDFIMNKMGENLELKKKLMDRIFLMYPNYSLDASFIDNSSIRISYKKGNASNEIGEMQDGNDSNDYYKDGNDNKNHDKNINAIDCRGEICNNGAWFLILDPENKDSILSIKHVDQIVTCSSSLIMNIELELNREIDIGESVKILCMSDCWIGCDQEIIATL